MKTIYVYILDTLADWELGHVISELNSGRFFKKEAQPLTIQTISNSKKPITTMGGMTIIPDGVVEDIAVDKNSLLLLPGADTWSDPNHQKIIEIAAELLELDAIVGAICGGTVALARLGLLDNRPHTSNGPGFLEMMCSAYHGQAYYLDQPVVADHNLITANSTAGLLWAKQIIQQLEVFNPDTLEAWFAYFSTGKPEHFFTLMQTLPDEKNKA